MQAILGANGNIDQEPLALPAMPLLEPFRFLACLARNLAADQLVIFEVFARLEAAAEGGLGQVLSRWVSIAKP